MAGRTIVIQVKNSLHMVYACTVDFGIGRLRRKFQFPVCAGFPGIQRIGAVFSICFGYGRVPGNADFSVFIFLFDDQFSFTVRRHDFCLGLFCDAVFAQLFRMDPIFYQRCGHFPYGISYVIRAAAGCKPALHERCEVIRAFR